MKIIITISAIICTMIFLNCKKNNKNSYFFQTYYNNTPVKYNYSIFKSKNKTEESTILYYFHGSGGDESSWLKYKELINYWEENSKTAPVVVSVTFGPQWILAPKNTGSISKKVKSLEILISEIIPAIEKKIGNNIHKRFIFGESMGGHNAAQLVFRHPDLFTKAVITSPSVYPFSIYASNNIINEYVEVVKKKQTGMTAIKVFFYDIAFGKDIIKNNIYTLISAQRSNILDKHSWERTDIILNMKAAPEEQKPEIYISCGRNDELGLYFGAEKLKDKALSLHYPVKWRSLKGGHMAVDQKEIAAFLSNN